MNRPPAELPLKVRILLVAVSHPCSSKVPMTSQGLTPQVTMAIKPPSACTRQECLTELRSFGLVVSERLTGAELRACVRKNRVDHGYMRDNKPHATDLMDRILRGTLRDLKMLADELNVGYSTKMGHGEMRLHLRRWLYRQGTEETVVSFGRHAGKTFGQVSQKDLQYLQWAVKETQTHAGASWQLIQMATWAVLSGLVDNPFDHGMSGRTRDPAETDSTTLEAILAIDPEVFVKHIEPKTPETGGSHGSKAASSQPRASPETELILTLRALKDEVRALSEKSSDETELHEKNRKQDRK